MKKRGRDIETPRDAFLTHEVVALDHDTFIEKLSTLFSRWPAEVLERVWTVHQQDGTITHDVADTLTFSKEPLAAADLEKLLVALDPTKEGFSIKAAMQAFLVLTKTVDELLNEYELKWSVLDDLKEKEGHEAVNAEIMRVILDNDLYGCLPVDEGGFC